jgi:hypothetical protein
MRSGWARNHQEILSGNIDLPIGVAKTAMCKIGAPGYVPVFSLIRLLPKKISLALNYWQARPNLSHYDYPLPRPKFPQSAKLNLTFNFE